MAPYAGSLDSLVGEILELETRGQVGRHVADHLVQYARWVRESAFQAAKSGESDLDSKMSEFIDFTEGLEACNLLDSTQCERLLQLILNVAAEGSHACLAGGYLKLCKVKRTQQLQRFELPAGHSLQSNTPLMVLLDLGISPLMYNACMREGWRTIADLPKSVGALLELRLHRISYDSVSTLWRILIGNGYIMN